MSETKSDNIIGFFASFNGEETEKELVKSILWSENGLKNKLAQLKWKKYGQDLHLILFEFYINPIPYLRKNIRKIENYKSKEKSIGSGLFWYAKKTCSI